MQVIGFCRFSYPAEGGFQVEHDSIGDRMDFLYAPARMEERFRHFETLCLPGLKAQTDPDFTFVILVGDSLPAPHLARLKALIADFPQAKIVSRPPMPHRKVCQEVINAERGDLSAPCLQFRHDDDDAVAVNFVQRLRQAARDCEGLVQGNPLVGFDFNRGYVTTAGPEGIRAREELEPFWGVALGMSVKAGHKLTIMNFMHRRLPRFMPTVTLTDAPMYIRGHNGFNDSRQGDRKPPAPLPLLDDDTRKLFRETYAIDNVAVRRAFA